MRDIFKAAPLFAVALGLAACGEQAEPVADEAALNTLDADTLYEPGNDVSAMEAASNELGPEAEPAANAEVNAAAETEADVLGDTDGGDTGGNVEESDVTGM